MPRQDIYSRVTDRIITQLEAGKLPWAQPWSSKATSRQAVTLPRNAVSHRPYSGINVLLLWGAAMAFGYESQTWLTYKQAQALGGNVRKGEKGETVFYASRFIPKAEAARAAAAGEEPKAAAFLKAYTVFNVAQCDGLPASLTAAVVPLPECEQHAQAEALIKATGADFRIGGSKAFYVPSQDYIQVPPQPAFHESINYYRTCFHELGHWTGHKSRLDRNFSGCFGDSAYAREELVAEMTAAFVCASMQIEPTVRHADYIGSWLEVLRNDNRAIFQAASKASKSADFLLAFASEEETAEQDDQRQEAA